MLSGKVISRLAAPFEGGSGPSHSVIERIFASEDASDYLGEGNKMERVLHGLRALRDGRRGGIDRTRLEPDQQKLHRVATQLAEDLVARSLIEESALDDMLDVAQEVAREPESAPSPKVEQDRVERLADASRQRVSADSHKVMVVHGQDTFAARAMFDWLRAVGLWPAEWSTLITASGTGSPFIGDVLDKAFETAQAVVVLFTPDEHVRLRRDLSDGEWRLQARPNVLFEAGMAFGSHPGRTVLVVLGAQELPSDLAGRHYVRLGTPQALRDLARRLENAGCPVDVSGTDWLDMARFPDRSELAGQP